VNNGQLTNIVEALLFAAAEPLPIRAMCRVLEGTKTEDIEYSLTALNQRYTQANASFRVREIAGGYQMCTLPEYAGYIEALLAKTKKQRFSGAALETLAVIAYRQPVTSPEIERIRGVESSGVLRTLLERKVISIVGRSEKPGRPLLYGTTKDFLYYFGLNHLRELPRVEELEKLLRKHETGEQMPIGLSAKADGVPPVATETATEEESPSEQADTATTESETETPPVAAETTIETEDIPEQAEITEAETEVETGAPSISRLVLKKTTPEVTDVPQETPADSEVAVSYSPAGDEEAIELPVPKDKAEEEPEILRTAEGVVTSPVE
jgi:segregation and condensation protein B